MGKNAHPPRNTGKKKFTQPDDDLASNIVFQKDSDEKTSKPTKSKTSTFASAQADNVKRVDTRKLIGGASWTGKLPMNLLSEHCQKQRWEKPEYTLSKKPNGFSSSVLLKFKNPKLKEPSTVPPLKLPPSYEELAIQPTAVEARHFAATYALFRVSSMKNISTILPPTYRDLWKQFQEIKTQDVKDGKAWMYEADPFSAWKEQEHARAEAAVQREKKQKDVAIAVGNRGLDGVGFNSTSTLGWGTAAKVEMGSRIRKTVESLVRGLACWNPSECSLTLAERATIADNLVQLGFRQSHVEEAGLVCRDQEEALEWLLVHVPEDDLPAWCLPEKYSVGVQMASGNLKKEAAIERLVLGGYSREVCMDAYESFDGDESRVAQFLQDSLLGQSERTTEDVLSIEQSEHEWDEEQGSLSAIYGDRYKQAGRRACRIRLETTANKREISVAFQLSNRRYPDDCPVLIVEAALPAYIRLSITRQAIMFAQQHFAGSQMMFNIIDWIESNQSKITENPGRLVNVSGVGSSLAAPDSREKRVLLGKTKAQPTALRHIAGTTKSLELLETWRRRMSTPEQQKLLSVRQALPAWKRREAIVSAVNTHQVVIISGETGSGKSTQVPQYLLDDMIQRGLGESTSIICTQPRRISALGLAERVAEERCSPVGREIGYIIRGEAMQAIGITKCTFVTTGILLRRLQSSGGTTAALINSLADTSHIILDEVHERDLNTDFLLALLRDVLRKRPDLRLILMSATLDSSVFEAYFGGPRVVACVEIEGRTFPVEDIYLDDIVRLTNHQRYIDGGLGESTNIGQSIRDIGFGTNYDLIADLVQEIDEELGDTKGGILIFVSGIVEIKRTMDAIIRCATNFHALPLHASLLPSEQRRVFFPTPADKKRKIIVATNVAETSITIPDIVVVIDSGKVKATRYDPQTKIVKLEEGWVSLAAAKQRRGRAGRVRAGKCYKLYTQNVEARMAERPDPEIKRTPLEQLCLSVKAMGIEDVQGFLASSLTPPEQLAVENALALLNAMGAIEGNTLTALGRHMSMIPADLRCGKLLVMGTLFGLLDPCLTLASILSVRSPFVSPQEKREESKTARTGFGQGHGDLIADLRAYNEWTSMRISTSYKQRRIWCEQNFLSMSTLQDVSSTRAQLLSALEETGLAQLNKDMTDGNYTIPDFLLNALILSALYPQTLSILFPSQKYQATVSGALAIDPESREIKYYDADNQRAFIHPSSTLFSAQAFPNNAAFISYFNKVATSKPFVKELTPCGAYGLLLFGGHIELDTRGRGLVVDGWIRLRGWARIGVLVSRLRRILDGILQRWVEEPGSGLTKDERRVIDTVRRLIDLDGMDR